MCKQSLDVLIIILTAQAAPAELLWYGDPDKGRDIFNGKLQTLSTGSTRAYHKTMDGHEVAPKWGCYNRAAIGTEVTVDLADLRIGTDLKSVMPKPVTGKFER